MAKQDVTVELFYDSAWNDHTSDVYVRDDIKISHGKTDAYSSAKPAKCELTFKSPNGEFNPKNPNSSLFGKIGRSTPVRVSVGSDVRFNGEASSWVPRRAIKGDAWTEVTAYGISHRISQGSIEPLSPMRDYIEREASDVVAYWPLEEGSLARAGAGQGSGDPSSLQAVTYFGTFPNLFDIGGELTTLGSLGAGDIAPWLPPGLRISDNRAIGGLLTMTDTPGTQGWWIDMIYSGSSVNSGSSSFLSVLVEGNGAGSSGAEKTEWEFVVGTSSVSTNSQVGIDDGSVQGYMLNSIEADFNDLTDRRPHHLRIYVRQSLPGELTIIVYLDGDEVYGEVFDSESVTLDGIAAVGVINSSDADLVIQHLSVGSGVNTAELPDHVYAAFGKPGQSATDRMDDVAAQYDGLDVAYTGDTSDVLHVGPRYTEPMLTVIRAAAAVDHGILHDDITDRQLRYRTGRDLYSQDAAITLDWDSGEIAPPLEPNIDDLVAHNRVTVRRRDGQRYSESDQDSIDKFGLINANATLNLPDDGGFLQHQAGWLLHLGTDESTRFGRVTADLDAAPSLAATVAALRPGDRIDLVNLPDDINVDDVSLLILGWTENIGSHRRKITYNCTPEAPYRIAEVGGGATLGTVGSTSATLAEDLTDSETGVDIDCGAGPDWDHEGTDYDVLIGGERVTVTAAGAVSGTFPSRTQTLTVTRSVNGVTKTHTSGDEISMADPVYIGL